MLNLTNLLFFLFWLLKPFYIFKSGTCQISDILLTCSFLFLFLKRKKLNVSRENHVFLIFCFLTAVVNFAAFLVVGSYDFFLPMLHYTYIAMFVVLAENLLIEARFALKLQALTLVNLLIQIIVYYTDSGRLYGEIRYQGTFNDPNQFGFSILTNFFIVFIISNHTAQTGADKRKQRLLSLFSYLAVIMLIGLSASTGMSLGIGLFTFCYLLSPIKKAVSLLKKSERKMVALAAALCVILTTSIALFYNVSDITEMFSNSEMPIMRRIGAKLSKHGQSLGEWALGTCQERGIDKLLLYPHICIFGAGEGRFDRFVNTHHQGEIHSTLFGILFCYGLVPFIILLKWIYKKFKNCSYAEQCVFIAVIIESFTLANQRQPSFWLILILPAVLKQITPLSVGRLVNEGSHA